MTWLHQRRLTALVAMSALALTLLSLWAGGPGRAVHDLALADTAAIHHGQLWRLATGPLLHATFTHLAWDLTILAILGALYEPRLGRRFLPVLLIGLLAPTLATALDARFTRYYGLSGLNYTLMGAAVAFELTRGQRSVGLLGAALLAWKLIRAVLGQSLWGPALPGDTHEAWLAHVVGAAAGAATILLLATDDRRSRRLTSSPRDAQAPLQQPARALPLR